MRQYKWRVLNGWRGLVIGIVLGVITSLLVFGWPDRADGASSQSSLRHELRTQHCSFDYSCRTSHQHRQAYKRGRYGAAPQRLRYPKVAKRRILSTARRAWDRRYGGTSAARTRAFNSRAAWSDFVDSDRCFAKGHPTNVTYCDRPGFMAEPAYWRKGRIRVVYCGATLVPAVFTGGAWLWIGWGATTCFWGFAVD